MGPRNYIAIFAVVLGLIATSLGVRSLFPANLFPSALISQAAIAGGILSVAFGLAGRGRARFLDGVGNNMALGGVILGFVGTVLGLLGYVALQGIKD